MRRFYTMIAVLALAIGSAAAQTMTLKIEGKEVKNGDNVVVNKEAKASVLPFGTMYDLGVEVELTSLIAQSIRAEGTDLDKTSPGLAVCPTGFTCGNPTSADNNYLTWVEMPSLEVGRQVKGEWIHYNYGLNNKPSSARKSTITFKGASETIQFNLTIDTNTTAINSVTVEPANNGAAFNLAGQRVNADAKGIIIRNGKKMLVK